MNLSGIVVISRPDQIDAVASALTELPGVEVHHRDNESGKLVVVQEAVSIAAEMSGLRRIQAVPGVLLAEMLYHYFEEDPEILEGFNARRNGSSGEFDRVPPSLIG